MQFRMGCLENGENEENEEKRRKRQNEENEENPILWFINIITVNRGGGGGGVLGHYSFCI